MADPTATSPRRRRLVRAAAVLGGLFVLYTAFGFLAAPAILRRVLEKQGAAALHRPVRVEKVRVNPLALSVTVDGLAVEHRDGGPFVGWDSLYVRLAPLRLVAGDVGFAEIRLVRPSVDVGLRADGTLSFQDLLARGDEPVAVKPAEDADAGGLGLSIGRLAVEEARVTFRDATRRPAFATTLGPVTIRLESFRTKGGGDSPYRFEGSTDAGESFRWTGTITTRPLRSAGTLAFERVKLSRYAPYLQEQLPIDVSDGLVGLETRYELEWDAARHVLRSTGGRVTVDRLALGPVGAAEPPVRLPRIEVTGVEVDAIARAAQVAQVAVKGGSLRVLREPDATLELARMAPPPSPPAAEPWRWSVGAVAIEGLDVALEDRVPKRPVTLALSDVALRLERLRPEPEAVSPLALALGWNGKGKVEVKGTVQPFASRGTLDVSADELDLVPLEPYLEPALSARLTGGRAGARLGVTFDASGAEPRWSIAGDARVDGLSVAEKGNDQLLRWNALEISGIDAASAPPRAAVKLVRLVEPAAKLYVWDDGATSLARALPAAAAAPAASTGAPAPARGPEWQTSIGAVQVVRGRATFVDRSVKPAALLKITRADAKVTRLSSDPKVRSTVDVGLVLDGASPVRITGTTNPLQKEAYTQLTVASEGVDLSPLDPYAGKFLGYGIQKGKLDLDLRYEVVQRNLAATNVVKVNQFTLGESTDSPDATKIPVRLALALLQDRDGVILLDVPVEGNLDDPEFRLGRVIWRTILNVLVKVATSPFAALGALAGGGDGADLSLVEFTPGTAEPLPAAQERFALLAKSLGQRPALGLELEGAADPEVDGPVLRQAAVERAREAARKATPPPQPKELEEKLAAAAAAEIPADVYRSLAAERAQRAREALLAAGLDNGRLFLAQGGRAEKEKGARVYFTVR